MLLRRTLIYILLALLPSIAFAQMQLPEAGDTYRPAELLVMLAADAPVADLIQEFPALNLATVQNVSPEWNIWLVKYNTASPDEQVKKEIGSSPLVKIVQFNHNNITLKSAPDDTLFTNQWDMTKISAPQAWGVDTGAVTVNGNQIVIATIDAGFDLSHPDMRYRINQYEIPGNGIDDDNNGYVDDYKGWNSILNSDSIPVSPHGTYVAGISGATGNNITGVSGVCWNVRAMPVVTDENNEASVVSAYSYIYKQRKTYNQTNGSKGAFVVATNSSFGPAGYGYQYPLWNAMYDSLGSVGILNAGATSNDANCNTDTCADIPSQCASDYTIIVTGTTINDIRHGGYGPHNVDIAAPGNGSYTISAGGGYGAHGGTSAASPHVAGAIGLMWSAACAKMLDDYKQHPDSMARLMKQYLLQSVDTLPSLVGLIVSGGRLNVYKALQKVKAYDCDTTHASAAVPKETAAPPISIYPNPVKDVLQVTSKYGIERIEVCNFQGINILRQKDTVLYTNSWLQGIYFVSVTDKRGNYKIEKVVKQ